MYIDNVKLVANEEIHLNLILMIIIKLKNHN